jgi:hypothetical protein
MISDEVKDAIESAGSVGRESDVVFTRPTRGTSFHRVRAIVLAVVRELRDDMTVAELRDELEIAENQ